MTEIRDECHIDKSPLTFHNNGVHVRKVSQDVKADNSQRLVCGTLI